MLLVLFGLALSAGGAMVMLTIHRAKQHAFSARFLETQPAENLVGSPPPGPTFLFRPACWLAIKSRNLLEVQAALELHNPKPCSWVEGLAGEAKLFIAPPVRGWILVMGTGLPAPEEDVDACFRFLLGLSRKLGHVQFFSASSVLHHHAWVRTEKGKVVRAYAWAGATLWDQGARTVAERDLDLRCFSYGETAARACFGEPDVVATNVDKVALLAARWSLDPAGIDERLLAREHGIAGEPSRHY
jgi:hypothetical protein